MAYKALTRDEAKERLKHLRRAASEHEGGLGLVAMFDEIAHIERFLCGLSSRPVGGPRKWT